MKTLNEKAVNVLTALLERNRPLADNDNGKVRKVQAEVANTIGRYKLISLTYYYDEDGYLMREPEITICHDTITGEYFPMSILYELAAINSNSMCMSYGRLHLINEKIQSDHVEITDRFLETLGERHGLL